MARPRKSDALDIPRLAVETSISLLEQGGPEALTLARVAAAVGCKAPALYTHFRNKDALLRAVHDEGFRRLYALKLTVGEQAQGDAVRRLRDGGLAYLRFARENPALYRLMFDPPPLPALAGDPFTGDIGARALGFLRAGVAGAQREGWFGGQDADRVAFLLWSTVHGAATLVAQNRAPTRDSDGDRLLTETVDLILALGAPRPLGR